MVISEPLSSYKCKDDVIILAGTLSLKVTGTIPKLTANIKEYLTSHMEIQNEPQFAGLYLQTSSIT
jgi:hypothetical protein